MPEIISSINNFVATLSQVLAMHEIGYSGYLSHETIICCEDFDD